jgi:carbonic anhydrase/acetyltransferase-like protein (isoleucine patch superfamily)
MLKAYKNFYPKIGSGVYIADNAFVIGDVELGDDVSVWFGTVIRGDVNYIKIGDRTNIQDNSVIHVTHDTHPTIIGHDVTIGHGAIIHGCTIKNFVLVGMGATIMDGATIEDFVLVGARALITPNKHIPSGVLVAGSPAKIVRDLKPEEIELIKESASNYVRYKNNYLANS